MHRATALSGGRGHAPRRTLEWSPEVQNVPVRIHDFEPAQLGRVVPEWLAQSLDLNPRVATVLNEPAYFHQHSLRAASGWVLPTGSRLSCGRTRSPAQGRETTVRGPPGAQHSASIEAINARQLQALVRPSAPGGVRSGMRITMPIRSLLPTKHSRARM